MVGTGGVGPPSLPCEGSVLPLYDAPKSGGDGWGCTSSNLEGRLARPTQGWLSLLVERVTPFRACLRPHTFGCPGRNRTSIVRFKACRCCH